MTFTRDIAAPVERVWSAMTDVDRYAERFQMVDAAQRSTSGPFGVGTRWQETRTVYGQPTTVELQVAECEPHRRYLTVTEAAGTSTMEYVFTPRPDGGTSVAVTFRTTGGPAGARLARWLARQRIEACAIEHNTQDLADLARVCES